MSKNKNFVFAERVKLEHHLNCNLDVSAIKLAKILDRSRSSIYYELKHFSSKREPSAAYFNKKQQGIPLRTAETFPLCLQRLCQYQVLSPFQILQCL